jgi:ATP-dependent RNA helicase RhlE
MNILKPTRVQVEAMPAICAGENVLLSAATGTGKTLAYLAPLVSNVLQAYKNGALEKRKTRCARDRKGYPSTLILTPNRELATQVARIMDTFHDKIKSGRFKDEDGKRCRVLIDYALCTGGDKVAPQKRALRNGADVVIATPQRLSEHIQAGYVDLSKLRSVVLDEADLLLVRLQLLYLMLHMCFALTLSKNILGTRFHYER